MAGEAASDDSGVFKLDDGPAQRRVTVAVFADI